MFRSAAALALSLSSAAVLAHDQTPQTAQPAAAPQPSAAERNAAANAPLPPEQAAMKAHILFLASDEARYITATEIVVDGGLIATMP